MRVGVSVFRLAFSLFALICGFVVIAQAQQSDAPGPSETFETVYAKAHQECMGLWSDHALDPLRKKLPLLEDKPTLSMLTNKERLRAKDRPLADLAIKTLEKCRSIYAPAYALLPQQVQILFRGVDRKQDALIAELYDRKITFGDFNVAMNGIIAEVAEALGGFSNKSRSRFAQGWTASRFSVAIFSTRILSRTVRKDFGFWGSFGQAIRKKAMNSPAAARQLARAKRQ